MTIEEAVALANRCGYASKRHHVHKLTNTSSDRISSDVAVLMKQLGVTEQTAENMSKEFEVIQSQIALIKSDMAQRIPEKKQPSIMIADQTSLEMLQ